MRRIIGLDLGSKTIGIAQSDYMHVVASAYKTLYFQENDYQQALHLLLAELENIEITKIVLGMPRHMSGEIGIRGNISLDFKKLLEAEGFEVILWDERYSSQAATKALISGNVSRKNLVFSLFSRLVLSY